MALRPIIYVRGYAMSQADIEETVDDPFYGFNMGSTHYRINQDGAATFFAFESPFVRLMTDHGYADAFFGSRQTAVPLDVNPERTIWIHRYYDETSQSFEDRPGGRRLTIEEAASDLAAFIDRVLSETKSEKIFLVAHSMGGLVCRCLLQKIYPDRKKRGSDYVDKMVTFGTPHGGISFRHGLGAIERVRDFIGIADSDNFGRARMYEFLTPGSRKSKVPVKFEQDFLPQNALEPDRVLCIVGTNSRDYEVAHGFSRFSVGPQSDGLVQIQNASLQGAHRAYIHRCHSGRFGMVNSEEGYQNLRRFLFGDVKVEASLCDFDLHFDPITYQGRDLAYHIEVHVAVRSLPMLLHERTLAHFCPVTLNRESYKIQKNKGGLPLFTNFLLEGKKAGDSEEFTFRLAIHSQEYENGIPILQGHLERLPLWSDYLVVELNRAPEDAAVIYFAKFSWASDSRDPVHSLELKRVSDAQYNADVPLPERAHEVFGKTARIHFGTFDWT